MDGDPVRFVPRFVTKFAQPEQWCAYIMGQTKTLCSCLPLHAFHLTRLLKRHWWLDSSLAQTPHGTFRVLNAFIYLVHLLSPFTKSIYQVCFAKSTKRVDWSAGHGLSLGGRRLSPGPGHGLYLVGSGFRRAGAGLFRQMCSGECLVGSPQCKVGHRRMSAAG